VSLPRKIALTIVLVVLSLASVLSVSSLVDLWRQPSGKLPTTAIPEVEATNVRIVFYDFYKRPTTLFANGRKLFEGILDVEDDSTGISLVLPAKLAGPTTFRLISADRDETATLEVRGDTKLIYVNPGTPPYMKTSSDPVIQLD